MQCPEEYEYECKIPSDFKIDELKLFVPYFSPPWFVRAKLAYFSSSSLFCRELLAKIEASDTNSHLGRKFNKGRVDQELTFENQNLPIWPQHDSLEGSYKDMESLRKSLARNRNTPTFDQLMECWVYGFKGSKALSTDGGAWFFTVNLS